MRVSELRPKHYSCRKGLTCFYSTSPEEFGIPQKRWSVYYLLWNINGTQWFVAHERQFASDIMRIAFAPFELGSMHTVDCFKCDESRASERFCFVLLIDPSDAARWPDVLMDFAAEHDPTQCRTIIVLAC